MLEAWYNKILEYKDDPQKLATLLMLDPTLYTITLLGIPPEDIVDVKPVLNKESGEVKVVITFKGGVELEYSWQSHLYGMLLIKKIVLRFPKA